MEAKKYKRGIYEFRDYRESSSDFFNKGTLLCDVYEKGTDIYRATIPTDRIVE